MIAIAPPGGVRFGPTTIVTTVGNLLDQPVEAVILAANRRGGIATAASAALRSLGAADLERQAMARAPLDLGTAIASPATGLETLGIRVVVHAVVHPALGEAALLDDVRRATAESFVALGPHKVRSLALPLLGAETGVAEPLDPDQVTATIVEEVVGCLRRGVLRPDHIILLARSANEAEMIASIVAASRRHAWVPVP